MKQNCFPVDDLKNYITANVPVEFEMAHDAVESEFQSLTFVFPFLTNSP